ncbi:hypothetical protein [Halorarum salinum]|uniref:Uncharacterized protein n=1 Tax=Halorarum salinum TaxID=2743089 RepID=A0A7D5LBD3_9EURY|nr:hypothetical protein [Halobaculum salinum]QLG62753.1 hypothetical protein HUG12_13860 [Halobaculum salinum]
MRPTEAVRQLEHVIDATTTDGGRRCAVTYRRTFERVAADGTGDDVTDLATALGTEVRRGNRPSPAQARREADRVLGVATDGGE